MKKILSLALALLMLGTLAVSASASGAVYTFSDLLDFYKYYSSDDNLYYEILGEKMEGHFYTKWLDSCPKCGGTALYRAVGNGFKYTCMDSSCSASGSIELVEKDETVTEKPNGITSIDCPKCDLNAKYVGKVTIGGAKYWEYRCEKDHETFVKDEDVKVEWDEVVLSPVMCSQCNRYAEFTKYYTYGDDLFALFTCAKNHLTYKKVSDNIVDKYPVIKDDYRIHVYTSGNGTYTIYGGSTADYGEYRTIKFTAGKNYTLTSVTINGRDVSVNTDNEITVKVTKDLIVRATFTKHTEKHVVSAASTGYGTITATYGSKTVDPSKITVGHGDKITYKFVPASANYTVTSLKINGLSVKIPASGTYTLSGITADTKITVTFGWKSPYTDVSSKYLNAVEYVTEAGIMGAADADGSKLLFKGTSAVTVKAFAVALAEMADIADKMDTTAERLVWAEKYGLVKANEDLSVTCDVQTAAKMVNTYLSVLEELNDIEFDKYDDDDSVKENAVSIGLVTAKTYETNRDLCRYDLASVCRLIANLKYDD